MVGRGRAPAIAVVSDPRRFNRLTAFRDIEGNKEHLAWQSWQGLLSIANGGLDRLGHRWQQLQARLPARSPTATSSSPSIADELGFVGSVAVVGGFALLVWFGVQVALAAPDRFGMILAGGIAAWFGVQAIVNLGGVVGLMPVTGLTLPFFSAGGTSLFTSMVAAGLLLNVARRVVTEPRQGRAKVRGGRAHRSSQTVPDRDTVSEEDDAPSSDATARGRCRRAFGPSSVDGASEPRPRSPIVTGGGTAGHVLPALAVADALVARGHDPDSPSTTSARASGASRPGSCPRPPIPHVFLDVVGFQRQPDPTQSRLPPQARGGRVGRRSDVCRTGCNRDVVVSVGGYASMPAVLGSTEALRHPDRRRELRPCGPGGRASSRRRVRPPAAAVAFPELAVAARRAVTGAPMQPGEILDDRSCAVDRARGPAMSSTCPPTDSSSP